MVDASAAVEREGLARGAIGLREVLFQAVTSMAPAGAVALSISLGATYAGGALPLSVLLALVGCLWWPARSGSWPSTCRRRAASTPIPPRASTRARVPGGLGILADRDADRADHDGAVRLPGGLGHAGRVQLAVHRHLGDLHDRRGAGDRRAQLPRGPDQRPYRDGARRDRDHRVPGPGHLADHQGGLAQHALGLHPALRHGQGVQRLLWRGGRLHLHDPGVHRLRGGRAAGRGGARPAAHHQDRGGDVLPGDRPVLRPHHLRGRRVLRAHKFETFGRSTAAARGSGWPATSGASAG